MVEFYVQWWVDVHPHFDDVCLWRAGLGQVKYGFQLMLELFVKRDTYSYEMDSRRSLENVGGSGEGAVVVYEGQAPTEGDDRVERPIAEFIPEEREPSEDANDNSSSEESWPNSVREEVEEEEEDVELPLPTMGVPPLEENDAPYPDPWIGVMDMDVTYRNTMVPGVDDDNVPPPVGIGVGQRFMTKDALVMHLKDYCISRHVQFRVRYSRAWTAKNKALVVVFGGWDESYNLLPQFFKAIKDTNRGRDGRRPFIVRSGLPQERGHLAWGGPRMHGMHRAFLDSTTLAHGRRMLPYVEASGVWCTTRVRWLRLDKPLITALVERWRAEANTFYLANGEMTITLEGVGILLGLSSTEICGPGRLRGIGWSWPVLGGQAPTWKFSRGRFVTFMA
ncbi:hypothetical protein H6P81_012563 [Aristolochia fimbriata]|uniref:Aminotransferase-like plant mobile domain-containing protein n=1 Tax=Aristolochia fimbriata TaxID=158543 RepID=A0AAV7EC62_ARIFI|nr:hypothetical protein H6P81_012563 [Aristolochia fimbriata]